MSCILYNKASYDAMAECHTVELFRREVLASRYPTARDFTDALFELNLRAYCDRYEADSETEKHNFSAEGNQWIDDTFKEFIAAEHHPSHSAPLKWATVFELLGRIEYQCSDANDFQNNEVAWQLDWFTKWAGRRMAEHIKSLSGKCKVAQTCE